MGRSLSGHFAMIIYTWSFVEIYPVYFLRFSRCKFPHIHILITAHIVMNENSTMINQFIVLCKIIQYPFSNDNNASNTSLTHLPWVVLHKIQHSLNPVVIPFVLCFLSLSLYFNFPLSIPVTYYFTSSGYVVHSITWSKVFVCLELWCYTYDTTCSILQS